MKRIYIFPRYSGDENSDWYQKAKQKLMLKDKDVLVIPLTLPNWNNPDISEFLAFIEQKIPQNEIDSNTFFVGHSVGCRAALLCLNEVQKKNVHLKIGGLMCIAGWWTVDDPWPQLDQWIDITIDFNRIQEICNHNITNLISDNDPYTSDTQKNKKLWEDRLNAKVFIIPDAKHFNIEGADRIISELSVFINEAAVTRKTTNRR